MKRRSCIYINDDLAVRLAAAADQLGVSKSGLVAATLHRFLDETEEQGRSSIKNDLAGIRRQLDRLDHDLKIVNETVTMHARYHLAVTPPIPEAAQRTACAIGEARFDEFAAQVARRVHTGKPLIRETLERLSTTRPELLRSEDGIALGDHVIRPERTAARPSNSYSDNIREKSMRPAAARLTPVPR